MFGKLLCDGDCPITVADYIIVSLLIVIMLWVLARMPDATARQVIGEKDMAFPKRATATCVSLAMLIVVTAFLWWVKRALPNALHHPVFFYLLPTALVAVLYGMVEGALFAVAAFVCSAFLLYDPVYSFYLSSMRALGELFWFLVIALVGVKCVVELSGQSEKT
jgi:K+-sensing histidine kinase KdpD